MLLSDIEARVNSLIRPEQVFSRMLGLALETVELSAEHKRSASYSPCECPYCAAIKVYVRAKIRCKRLTADNWVYTSRLTCYSEIDVHNAEQAVKAARQKKEEAKVQMAFPALLND